MDAIKKKMQAMKLEKDNALDRAAMCEQEAKDANLRAEKAEEEARQLQKKIQTIENELDQTQEALMQVNGKLEEKEKALQTVNNTKGNERRRQRHVGILLLHTFSQYGGAHCAAGRSARCAVMSASAPHAHGRTPVRRRGHQHHPRMRGDRLPAPGPTVNKTPSKEVTLETDDVVSCVNSVSESQEMTRTSSDDALSNRNTGDDSNIDDDFNFDTNVPESETIELSDDDFSFKEERSLGDGAEMVPPVFDIISDDDPETAELAKLRCPSECTEVLAARENRRNRRCADYPGLAFGSSIFSSDTIMKFSIIKNELQNIKNTALKRQGTILDVLKKKMRQTKEEMEKYKDECEEYHKRLQVEIMRREEAESEVAALNRRIQLLEEDLERSEERLATATAKLAEASQAADESERIRKALENRTNMEDDRVAILEAQLSQAKLIAEESDKKYEELFVIGDSARKVLENRSLADEERMDALENQLKEARFLAEEADKKYDEVARKLAMVEADLERAEERAETGESKIVELEEELRVVGNNLKSLEVSEEKANQREEEYKNQIKTLTTRLKEAEARAEFAERSVQKLQKEVDRLEDDLVSEREKSKLLQEEMEATLHDIQNM
ncbi:unnamed protein product [Pieris brassicae]|uniref:Tropomyosin n=1 Tax=Pieris brassicae TaxID=7116 RepID=A0A9P0T626_PIEBR|nr:unnamed protein product [Pieris brassicae]